MNLSVIIPVHNGGEDLRLCLEALTTSSRLPDEIWVVDDASSDDSAALARSFGAQVISLPQGPCGPGTARNRGAGAATGDILIFFDADVVVHKNTTERIAEYFTAEPELAALFGSYDAAPPARSTVTLYKNLLHHYVHHHSRREASTFWTGCGAVRREVFQSVGGFDAKYERPSIEDIELGRRLSRDGHRIWLCPDVQVTHLKRWTLSSMLRTDIFCRAVPWTRLLLREKSGLPNDLNLDFKSRLSAVTAWLAVLMLAAGFWNSWFWLGAFAGLGAVAACNADLLRSFRRQGGSGFALRAFGLHTLYFLYSSLTFGLMAIPHKLSKHVFLLLLLATLFKGLAWSIMIPPWQAPDEPQHFLYGQSVERSRTLSVEFTKTMPQDVWLLADAVQFDWLVHKNETTIDFSKPARMSATVAAADSPNARRTLVRETRKRLLPHAEFTVYHPPLYYVLIGAAQATLENQSVRVRLLASRWVSLALGLVTVALAFFIGCEVWPRRRHLALLLATLVSFQPMTTFTFSTISNSALEIALFSAFLLLALRVMRDGLSTPRAFSLVLVTTLGLLTKISFLSVLPLLVLVMIHSFLKAKRLGGGAKHAWRSMKAWLWITAFPLLMSGWWYLSALSTLLETIRSAHPAVSAHSAAHLPFIIRLLSSESVVGKYGRVLISYWGNFGWPDTMMSLWILAPLCLLTFITVTATARWLLISLRSSRRPDAEAKEFLPSLQPQSQTLRSLLFLGCATLVLVIFYICMTSTIRKFGIRGQYYLPAISGQMAWLLCGAGLLLPRASRPVGLWLLGAGMVALNFYGVFDVILPRYYGAVNLAMLLERVTLLQPVSFQILAMICLLFLVSSGAFMLAFTGAFFGDADEGDAAHREYSAP